MNYFIRKIREWLVSLKNGNLIKNIRNELPGLLKGRFTYIIVKDLLKNNTKIFLLDN